MKPLAAVMAACFALPAAAQDTPAAAPDMPASKLSAGVLFGAREQVQAIDISPDGKRIVYVAPGPGRVSVAWVAELAGGEPRAVLESNGNPERMGWCKFASNQRLVCQFSGMVNNTGLLTGFSRRVAIGIDGSSPAPLGQRGSRFDAGLRQSDGYILDWLPDQSGALLMARAYVPEAGKIGTKLVRTESGLGVDRIDVATMQSTPVVAPIKQADFFISDGRGEVRIKGYNPAQGGSGQMSSRWVYHYRKKGSSDWLPFATRDDGDGMAPIDVEAACDCAYVLRKLDGREALYRVKLDGSMATELVYKNDKVDVDGVVRIGDGSRVIGVSFAEEKRSVIYFDPEYDKLAKALGKALPNLPMVSFLGSSADNNVLLIRAGSDADPGRYYTFDKAKRALNEILLARPELENVALASVKPVSYPAADGTAIPGYLTLPPGKESARGLPAVVLPHGGPSARDEWGFDWLAQSLAHQGYAVLQPNYRGSKGYGDAWLQENGFKSWRTSIGDVNAAGKWLVAQGIADPARLAIVGWSYGGYAALQAGVLEPGLFKALVAIAPVTDLDLAKRDASDYTHRRLVAEYIGTGPHITQGSPLQNVSAFTAPVLMFHGDFDANVGVEQSRRMDAKLRAAGKSSELVVYQGLEHDLDDSAARAQMIDRIGAFLGKALAD